MTAIFTATMVLVSLACSSRGGPVVGGTDDPVLVGAADIASGDNDNDEATAKLLDGISGTVFTAGDNAYASGSLSEYHTYYEPTWGRHKARTRPAPGNHEYENIRKAAQKGAGYFSYFDASAGKRGKGYYGYDVGEWRVISLNSMCDAPEVGGCSTFSPMGRWLSKELTANPRRCTLAYWHHPLFSSGSQHGSDPKMKEIFRILHAHGAEVVISGHDHDYERFAPQDPDGDRDGARGVRQFVVGTGGRSLRPFGEIEANSEARNSSAYGVVKLTLRPGEYDWEFVPVEGGNSFTDSGSGSCR